MKRLMEVAFAVSILLVGCASGPSASQREVTTEGRTNTGTQAASAEPTTLPTETPGWGEAIGETVCLQVEQSYPSVEEQWRDPDPVAEIITPILTDMGITVVRGEKDCDARLSIAFSGEPLGTSYDHLFAEGESYCYTGANVRGEVTLSPVDGEPVTLPISGHQPVAVEIIQYCPQKAQAPFGSAWSRAVLDGLRQLFGPQAVASSLKSDFRPMLEAAADSLAEMGPEGVSILINALDDHHGELRIAAARALQKMGDEAEAGVPALVRALSAADRDLRIAAAEAIEAIGEGAAEAVPLLIDMLAEEDWELRTSAGRALAGIGPAAVEAVPALIGILEHREEEVALRKAAVHALGEIGPGAAQAIPILIAALDDEDVGLRTSIALALHDLRSDNAEAVPALIRALEEDDWGLQAAAAGALGVIGPDALDAVPMLIRRLHNGDPTVRLFVKVALREITGEDFGEDSDAWQRWWDARD
jgi:HEAT repeat protein